VKAYIDKRKCPADKLRLRGKLRGQGKKLYSNPSYPFRSPAPKP